MKPNPHNPLRRALVTHCSKCGTELDESNATRRAAGKQWRSHCDPCRATKRREAHDVAEQAERLFITRQVCDICKQPDRATRNGIVRQLNKDHDHQTGEWRGLLCTRCNQAIGLFADNPHLLQNAIDYLTAPPGLVVLGKDRGAITHLGEK